MRNEEYWQHRAAQQMHRYMQSAEATADQISELYFKASRYLSNKMQGIFEKYVTKYGLTEKEARQLLNAMRNKTSIEELLQKLQTAKNRQDKQDILKQLEAPAYRVRIERLQELQSQIDMVMQQVYRQEKEIQTQHYIDIAKEVYNRTIFDIQQRAGVGFSFAHISRKQIGSVIGSKWSGRNYSSRIWGNTRALAQDLKEELLVNLITGRTEREVSVILAQKFAQGASNARRLVRTESCYVSNRINMDAYKECGIEKYRYLATLDLRTSEVCRGLDGKVFPVSEQRPGKNCPPMHPWCRSTTTADISAETLAKMKRRARDPETGKAYLVPASMTYNEWYGKYVEGNPAAEAQVNASNNASADRKQFEEYKKLLGKDMPKSFADFQNLKYNEPKKWEKLKKKKNIFSEISKKDWPDEFKDKARNSYDKFETAGFTLSAHALSRIPRLSKKGFFELSEEDVLKVLHQKPKYSEGEYKVIFFDEEKQLSIIKNRETEDIISIVRRKHRKEEWEDV